MKNDMQTDLYPGHDGEGASDLRTENEILKLKMEAEFGASIHASANDLPPELENTFLRSIYEFEKESRKNPARITVHRIIGEPEFRVSAELADDELEAALERLRQLLFDHQIILNTHRSYSSRTIYDFIVNELFAYEMENIRVPGYYCHFCYEDFHPDHEYDLYMDAKEFIKQIMNRTLDREYNGIYDQVSLDDGRVLPCTEVFDRIMLSISDFPELRINKLEIREISYNETDASVLCFLDYDGCFSDKDHVNINGQVKLGYKKDYGGYWYVSNINIPGIVI
jgi:hypothetical protein